ncbi:MAG: nucleoside-diphosphate kinase [Novosphingobium sp.]|nr:nucleoside-diphosphate kinase [Novosphingobium sp.]
MSVAFRRDGDEEHLEPKFELPIPAGPNLVTARGRKLIDARVAEFSAQIAALGAGTDLDRAKRDLRYWQTRQVTAELVPVPNGSIVDFGTTVRFTLKGKERSLTIVGHDEADPAKGLIGHAAPLSRALLGAGVGDVIEFGGDLDAIEVLDITVTGE